MTKFDSLTKSELRTFALVAQGKTNPEIALALNQSKHTVKASLVRLYRKMEAKSREELIQEYASVHLRRKK